jgi:hypothetical protein
MSKTKRRASRKPAVVDKSQFAPRIRKIVADLIEGDGPYLRREAANVDFTARIRQIIADAEGAAPDANDRPLTTALPPLCR